MKEKEKASTHVRIDIALKSKIDQTAANERRLPKQTLEMLIEDGFAFREMNRAKVSA